MGLAKAFGHLKFVVQDRVVVDMGVKVRGEGILSSFFLSVLFLSLLPSTCFSSVSVFFLWGVDVEGEGSGVADFWIC
jgi:hypothetical protein